MRILFLSPYVPHPVRSGGHSRTLGLVRTLTRFASVHVIAVGDPADPGLPAARAALGGATLEVHPATGPGPDEANPAKLDRLPDAACHFRSPGLAAALEASLRGERPDVVHVEELVMGQYRDAIHAPCVIDRQKLEWAYHEAIASRGEGDADWHRCEAIRFRRWEEALAARFAAVLVTAAADAERLAPLHGGERVHAIPIAVDDALFLEPARTARVDHVILYGALDYPPNAEAHAFYFREVWPRLSAAHGSLRTVVVGGGAIPEDIPRSDPRVEIRGYVEDIGAVLRGPGVLLVPLRVGGGSRTKVLEALATGMPVVATDVGVENLGLDPGRHYLSAASAEEMAAAVLSLVGDPLRVAALGRAGAARVDEAFRWDAVAGLLEPIYRRLAARSSQPAPRAAPPRALLIGVHPLPQDAEARALSFPGHRTAQFAAALRDAGCEVEGVLLDEEGTERHAAWDGGRRHVLGAPEFRAGRILREIHAAFRPDVVVSAGGYHPARVVAHLATDAPRWIDLAGDLAAEGQLRVAEAGESALRDALAVLAAALTVGDRFSVVGASQRLAVLGQLGLCGRLAPDRIGQEPVAVVPLASEGPAAAPPLPEAGFQIAWSGGYNTWMDEETLFAALEAVMARRSDVLFTSTGGPVPGHEQSRHAAFWRRVAGSRFAPRFRDLGRLPRREALDRLAASHLLLSIARPCLEAELGSRQRLVEALAHGRAVVVTALGDLPAAIAAAGAGLVVPPGEPAALATAILRLAEDRGALVACSQRARQLWEATGTYTATTSPLREWVRAPSRWPPSLLDRPKAADPERFRLQAELDAIRGSRTFRALRLFDRLTGRAGGRS